MATCQPIWMRSLKDRLPANSFRMPSMKLKIALPITSRRQFFSAALAGAIGSTSGCGTLLYPERRGQPSGRLDWGVVLLDGIGLILFFIPGVIAFAVDFATGAIYLPPREELQLSHDQRVPFRRVSIPRERLTPEEIAKAVSTETGQRVVLKSGGYLTAELDGLNSFWHEHERLAAAHVAMSS